MRKDMEDTTDIKPPVDRRPVERLVMPLSFGSLFAGIGGLDLGLERAGMTCKWQVEIDPYCRRVLERHWPTVRRWDDVRTWPQPDTERVDLLCGGFPCQDISIAGKRVGIEGERSGLWFEFARIIRDCRPRIVLVENVAALLDRGMDRVLWELAECGYDAEWSVLPTCALGAPHSRERLFLVANANKVGRWSWRGGMCDATGHADWKATEGKWKWQDMECWLRAFGEDCDRRTVATGTERVSDGVPYRVERCGAIGNAVSPIVAEWIGRRIVEAVESAA